MAEYIEREAAIKRFNFAVLDCLGMEPTIRAGDIIKALESIPAADVRHVVRGHNTGNARIFECSECGYGFSDIFLTNERDYPIDPNYCPNCGADMRGEADDTISDRNPRAHRRACWRFAKD